ncbi:RER1 protein [Zopfochytrium polystomum]|nr:RER1 protein [Zopfochytrium polystomum]
MDGAGSSYVDSPNGAASAAARPPTDFKRSLIRRPHTTLSDGSEQAVLLLLYFIRVWILAAFYIVTYALGIYLLNLFLAFLQPKFDPAMELDDEGEDAEEGPALPVKADDEFRPFIRRLPEFKFWYWATRGIVTALACTLVPFFDIPVFWPILVLYFFVLLGITMKQRIMHMIKYKYVPWNVGKKQYKQAGSPKK